MDFVKEKSISELWAEVNKPFYKEWWFYLICALSLCALFFFGKAIQVGLADQNKDPAQNAQASSSDTEAENSSEISSSEGVEVDEKLLSVTITLPANTVPQDINVDEYVKENGFKSAQLNEDGTLSVAMSKATYNQTVKEMKTELEANLKVMIGAPDTEYITDIKFTSSFDIITVYVDRALYNQVSYDFAPFTIGFSTYLTRVFYEEDPRCEIIVVYDDTEHVISKTVYPDALDEETSEGSGETDESVANITTGEANALKAAKNYLSVMAFSRDGLYKQLLFEEYTESEAAYAVDNCGADWNEQAAKCAKNYLDTMAFSRDGLIRQLEYEGFTNAQAVYGAEQNGY